MVTLESCVSVLGGKVLVQWVRNDQEGRKWRRQIWKCLSGNLDLKGPEITGLRHEFICFKQTMETSLNVHCWSIGADRGLQPERMRI